MHAVPCCFLFLTRLKPSGVEIDCVGIGGTRNDVDEQLLQSIASRDSTGRPRYWYIGDRVQLIQKFEHLANGLRAVNR